MVAKSSNKPCTGSLPPLHHLLSITARSRGMLISHRQNPSQCSARVPSEPWRMRFCLKSALRLYQLTFECGLLVVCSRFHISPLVHKELAVEARRYSASMGCDTRCWDIAAPVFSVVSHKQEIWQAASFGCSIHGSIRVSKAVVSTPRMTLRAIASHSLILQKDSEGRTRVEHLPVKPFVGRTRFHAQAKRRKSLGSVIFSIFYISLINQQMDC